MEDNKAPIGKWFKPSLEQLEYNKDYLVTFKETPLHFHQEAKYKGDGNFLIGLTYVFNLKDIHAVYIVPECDIKKDE